MSTRMPPPRGQPPPYAAVNRLYRGNLRPVVIFISVAGALWSLIWSVGSFQDIGVDKQFGSAKLGTFDIVLGAMYAAACAVDIYGVVAATMQRVTLVRIFSFLSVGATAILVTAQLLLFVLHFVLKGALINECEDIAKNVTITERIGVWGPVISTNIPADQIPAVCQNAWSHDSFSAFGWLVLVVLAGTLSCITAFAYLHQLRDPTSVANSSRAPSNQVRNYPAHYNPPYVASVPNLAYNAPYAPPPGPPPQANEQYAPPYDAAKVPGYGANNGMYPGDKDNKADDPFADFDGPTRRGDPELGERDVTSRPGPGGPEGFDV